MTTHSRSTHSQTQTLEAYPALRGMTDSQLCDLVYRGLVDEFEDEIATGICKCGNEFEYIRDGKPRKKCDACRAQRSPDPLTPLMDLYGSNCRYVLCVRSGDLYRRGNWYYWHYVQDDCSFGLVQRNNFDWINVRVGCNPARNRH